MSRKSAALPTLGLFDTEEAAEEPVVSTPLSVSKLKWSYSKRGVLEQCPRKFYYQYYGANRSKAKNDPAKKQLQQLKMVVNRHTRTGEILHAVIEDYLKKAQQGNPWNRQNLIDWARKIFERDISRSGEGLDAPVVSYQAYPAQFLVEFLHESEPRQLCREAEADMIMALEAFLDSPAIKAVRDLGMQEGTLIEKHFHNLIGFPFGIEGRVDLAHCSQNHLVTLVDWKSGDDYSDGDDSLQLAVYALWAVENFSCEAEAITLYKAFLGNSRLVEFPLSEQLLKVARLKIFQDAEFFTRMHEYGCMGAIEAFTPCAQEAVCRGCSFATVCPEGKESLKW